VYKEKLIMPKEENEKVEKPIEKTQESEVNKSNKEIVTNKPRQYKSGRPFVIAGIIILVILVIGFAGGMSRFSEQNQG
jgi:hypothetical protein